MKMRSILLMILLILTIPLFIYPQNGESKHDNNSGTEAIQKIDSLSKTIDSQFKQLRTYQINSDIETAKQHIERANRIIDWSAMFFALLTLILILAGGIGLKEFSNIRKIEAEMKNKNDQITKEFENIQTIKKDLQRDINDLKNNFEKDRMAALEEIENLKEASIKEGRELLQILFYLSEGDRNQDAGRLEEAITWYKQVLKVRKDDPEAYIKLGLTYSRIAEYACAITYLEEGLKISPQNVNILNALARAYRKSHQYNKAEEFYEKALDIDNEFIWALSGIAQIHIHKGNYIDAEKALHKILLKENTFHPYLNLGVVYAALNNNQKSKENFQKALSMLNDRLSQSQNNKWLLSFKSIALVGLSRYDEAYRLLLQLKEKGLYQGMIMSIIERLRIFASIRKSKKIKNMLNIFKNGFAVTQSHFENTTVNSEK